jgi:uncharacterized protein
MSLPKMRRQDKEMNDAEIELLLAQAQVGHFGTVSAEGFPYVVPNLFVYADGKIYTHNTSAQGHFRQNIEENPRMCFEVAQMGEVWAYGEYECDTTVSYVSVVAFGKIAVEPDPAAKAAFFDLFMQKYAGTDSWGREKGFYPRLEQVTVYSMNVERITGKKGSLPAVSERYPAVNNTRSPRAKVNR